MPGKPQVSQDELHVGLITVEKRSTAMLNQLALEIEILNKLHERLADVVTWLRLLLAFSFPDNDEPQENPP